MTIQFHDDRKKPIAYDRGRFDIPESEMTPRVKRLLNLFGEETK